VDSVHGGPRWCSQEHGGAPAEARRIGAMVHRQSPRGAEEGEGDVAVSGVPSPETERRGSGRVTAAKRWRLKARSGGELWHERGGKEGGVGCGEVRCYRGAFYRCQGGGRRPGDGKVKVAPLMAVRTGYCKRGRKRWPINEG
jgi:hypothetical protein